MALFVSAKTTCHLRGYSPLKIMRNVVKARSDGLKIHVYLSLVGVFMDIGA